MGSRNKVAEKAAVIGIGAALMFVLMRFAAIPTGIPDTNINLGIAVLAAFAAIFGPLAGFLIGLIGHALTDLSLGGIWWSWVISSALFGLSIGSFRNFFKIAEGGFGITQAFYFNGIQILTNALTWVFIARALDLLIYREPFEKVTAQGFVAAGVNAAAVLILGTLLIVGYTKIKAARAKKN